MQGLGQAACTPPKSRSARRDLGLGDRLELPDFLSQPRWNRLEIGDAAERPGPGHFAI